MTKGGTINGVDIPAIPPGGDVITIAIDDAELANYLPTDFDQANPFNSAFRIAIKRKPDGGKPIRAVVISGNATRNGSRLDDMSGVRIAAMVGSGGGVIRSDGTEAKGTMGLWKLDGPTLAAMFTNPDDLEPVRVVVTSDFTLDETENPLWKSVLFRESRNDFPDGNTMLTDIDMGGYSVNNAENVTADRVTAPTIYNLSAIRTSAGADAVNINQSTGEVTFNKNLIAKANLKVEKDLTVTGKTTTGTLQAGATTLTGALTGTTGTFSGAVSGTTGTFSGVITSNAAATPGAECGGGQVAKNGTSTMICDKGKWIKAEELAIGGDMCMTCYWRYDRGTWLYYSLNYERTCALLNNVVRADSTFRSVYETYKNSIGDCSFKANTVPAGWIQIVSGEFCYSDYESNSERDYYRFYNYYIQLYMKLF